MAKKPKKSTLAKAADAVKGAAETVVEKANEYIVEPVSKAVGVKPKKKPAKSPAAKKTGTTKAAKSATATTKSAPAKKAAAKRPAKGK